MTLNSRSKGKRGELELVKVLRQHWPEACRNIDQFGDNKQDVLNVKGIHFQIKRVERFNLWAALQQAENDASAMELPVVAFRRNRGCWYGALPLDELLTLLRLKETSR